MTENDNLPSLDSLQQKIASAKKQPRSDANVSSTTEVSMDGWRYISEMVAGIAVGGFLGYQADKFFETKAILMILGILVGLAGAMMNIYRASVRASKQAETLPPQGDE